MNRAVSPGALREPSGCLTGAGLAALAAAPPGRGPDELARHLASCGRCQQRLLETERPTGVLFRPRRTRPPLWRAPLLFLVGFVLALLALGLLALLGRR